MKTDRIAFRVDASQRIGTGHFMRCLTLAIELKARGAEIQFVSRDLPEYLQNMLHAAGISVALLSDQNDDQQDGDLAHSHWLGASQGQDAKATMQAMSSGSWDCLIVDHYALDARWESMLRDGTCRIMVIDDIADRQHDCDVLLDQNLYGNMGTRYAGLTPSDCRLLLGPNYALLRPEFGRLRENIEPRGGTVKKILVFFGGVDADNITGLAVQALAGSAADGIQVDIVVGALHPCLVELQQLCNAQGFIIHVQTEQMAELIGAADLAIGAGGSSSWERCCLGLPTVLVALADNQIDISKALEQAGACVYLGTSETLDLAAMKGAVESLLGSPGRIRRMSERALSLADGMGVHRVCEELGC